MTVAVLAIMEVFVACVPFMTQNRESATAASLARSLHEQLQAGIGPPAPGATFNGKNPDPPAGLFPPTPYPSVVVDGVTYTVKVSTLAGPRAESASKIVVVDVEIDWGENHQLHQQCEYYAP